MKTHNFLKISRFLLICFLTLALFQCSGDTGNPIIDDNQDTEAPPTPLNLAFLSVGNGEIHLKWDAVSAPDVAGYRLYRTEGFDVQSAYLLIYEGTEATFLDSPLNYSTIYFYKISAYDDNGNESIQSDPVQGMPSNTQPPDRPQQVTVSASNIGDNPVIRIEWLPNSESDLSGYMIYKGGNPAEVSLFVDSTYNSFYEDTLIVVDKIYYYKVTAFDLGQFESAPSETDFDVALTPPTLLAPIDNSFTTSTPNFIWQSVPNATQYQIFVTTTPTANEIWSPTVESSVNAIAYAGTDTLTQGTTYYWRVATFTKPDGQLNSISVTESFKIQ